MKKIDLENFPTNETAKRMMSRVSPVYDRSYVGKWLFQVMGQEMGDARTRFEELRLQVTPETATWGLMYWEMRYGIPVDETQSIEARRKTILVRRGIRSPMNPARIEKILGDMCGRTVSVTENVAPYTFQVSIMAGDTTVDYGELVTRLRKIKPSHQRFELIFEANTGVRIRPQRTMYRFPYVLTGTVPQVNTVGGIEDAQIMPTLTAEGHPFDYSMAGQHRAGTLPQTNTIGKAAAAEIKPEITGVGMLFDYQMTGTEPAGIFPQENTAGGVERASIAANVKATGSVFPYPITGTAPEVNTEGAAAGQGVTTSVQAQANTFNYPLCGEDKD